MGSTAIRGRLQTAIALLLAAPALSPALAAGDETNIWLFTTANHRFENGMSVDLGAQLRSVDDLSRLGQLWLEGLLNVPLASGVVATVGYHNIRYFQPGAPDHSLHMITEQLTYVFATPGPLRFDSRTRLNQMMLSTGGTRHRLRERVRVTMPLSGQLRGVAYGELFVSLGGQPANPPGIEQWRAFAGVAVPLSVATSLQTGYVHVVNVPGRNKVNHVLNLSLTTSF